MNKSRDTRPSGLDVRKRFAQVVLRHMREKGWTQSELARQASLSRDQISTYVRAKQLPTEESLAKLAGAFRVEPDDLLPDRERRGVGGYVEPGGAMELKLIPGKGGQVWLHVDRALPTTTALKILQLIEDAGNDN